MIHRMLLVMALAGLSMLAGCASGINPFKDELQVCPNSIDSPTVKAIRERNVQPDRAATSRFSETQVIAAADGTVSHYPLYFEDPTEERNDGDGQFAITGRDFGLYFYGIARASVNAIATPVSAVFDPPWSTEHSDGLIEDQYDATRSRTKLQTVSELTADDEVQTSYSSGTYKKPSMTTQSTPTMQSKPTTQYDIETIPVKEM